MTNASTTAIWVHHPLETYGACGVTGVLRPVSRWGAGTLYRLVAIGHVATLRQWLSSLWRTPLGVGNALRAWVGVVLSCKGQETGARRILGSRRRLDAKVGDVDWSISPHQAADRTGRLRSLRRPGIAFACCSLTQESCFSVRTMAASMPRRWPRSRSTFRTRLTGRPRLNRSTARIARPNTAAASGRREAPTPRRRPGVGFFMPVCVSRGPVALPACRETPSRRRWRPARQGRPPAAPPPNPPSPHPSPAYPQRGGSGLHGGSGQP